MPAPEHCHSQASGANTWRGREAWARTEAAAVRLEVQTEGGWVLYIMDKAGATLFGAAWRRIVVQFQFVACLTSKRVFL